MYYIGIDIGGTKIAIILSDDSYNILDKIKIPTEVDKDALDILETIVTHIKDIAYRNYIQLNNIKSIGISCGGPLDSKKGIILSPPNLPKWKNVEICKYLENQLDTPTYLLNDANACAIAEWKMGVGKGHDNIIFLTFGTGLGAGLILNGRLYEGINGQAGEVGHIRIDTEGPYGYGKYGSLESYCSGAGIKNLALYALENKKFQSWKETRLRHYEKEEITAELVFNLAKQGDIFCNEVIKLCAQKLGVGLSILIDLLNPELIIIGSIYSREERYFKDIVHTVIREETLQITREACKIVTSVLGDSIGDYAALLTASGKAIRIGAE